MCLGTLWRPPERFFCAWTRKLPGEPESAAGGGDFSAAEEGNEAALLRQARAHPAAERRWARTRAPLLFLTLHLMPGREVSEADPGGA